MNDKENVGNPEFKTYTTSELGAERLQALTRAFNEAFEKNARLAEMEQMFMLNPRGESYHSIMEHNGVVVGACAAIPYEYSYQGSKKTFAYLGGLFIQKAYRKDPLAMFKLYKNMRSFLVENGVDLIMAVPNDNAFPYFKVALKWNEVANLPYYALPVNLASISKINKIWNHISSLFASCSGAVNSALSVIYNRVAPEATIHIVKNEPLMEQHRYTPAHSKIELKSCSFFYRTVDEKGIRSSYLIDFYNSDGRRDRRTLAKAVDHIRRNEKPDIILFIGNLGFSQLSLMKVPRKHEPRILHFCVEIIDKENIREDVFDYQNWEFGLYNFDVR